MSSDPTDILSSNILVVDDTEVNLLAFFDLLSDEGHKVSSATSGRAALQAVKKDPPDLILLDINMPDMDGYQVCQTLKADPSTKEIPVIFISALDEVIDKVKAFAAGGVDYITRPFNLEEVLVRIENQLQLRHAQNLLRERNALLEQEMCTRKQAEALFLQYSDMLEEFSTNLKHLHCLNTSHYDTLEAFFSDALKIGCQILGLPTGIISQVENRTYTIQAVRSDLDFLAPNLTFNLADTFCSITIQARETVAETHAGKAIALLKQSTKTELALETYLGTPIFVNGEIYGTLCFFSTQVRSQSFGTQDRDIIELMAQSLGRSIAVRETEQQHQQVETALRSREIRLRHRNTVLAKLARNKALYRGNLSAALREIAEAAARTLEIEQASIWRYNETASILCCIELFSREASQHSQGVELAATDYPTYFKTLSEDWTIAAHDAYQDPRTRELAETYLMPRGIVSILATPIRLSGQTAGVLCLEQVGFSHKWSLEEQNFANSIADLVSLALEAQERQRTEEALRLSEEKFASAFHASPDPMAIASLKEGRYLEVNDSFLSVFGFAREEIIGHTPDELNSWVNLRERRKIARLMQSKGTVRKEEVRFRTADGSVKTILFSAEQIQMGDRACLLAVANDVTHIKQIEAALEEAQAKSRWALERVQLNPLVDAIANQPEKNTSILAERCEEVSILFADIVDFTTLTTQIPPPNLIALLNQIFSRFDQLAQKHGVEKIKTVGDIYMAGAGLPFTEPDRTGSIADVALAMQQAVSQFQRQDGQPLQLRIGIDIGPAIAGIVHTPENPHSNYIYDLWGDTVKIARWLESQASPGRIHVSAATYKRLKKRYVFEKRGKNGNRSGGAIATSPNTQTTTYWLIGTK